MTDIDAALTATALTKSYRTEAGTVDAVAAVDLTVATGEFVAVMGPSGCGKSTLLHLLAGIARPTSGQVTVAGRDLATLTDNELAGVRRHHVGVVFQAFNLVQVLTVAENVALPAVIAGIDRATHHDRVHELLTAVGLATHADKRPGQLSGGEQQRVAIARALVLQPDVLLADEPTGNVDTATSLDILGLFRRVHGAGQTVFLVTHDAKIAGAAQRILHMRDGRIDREQRLGDPGPAARPVVDFDDDNWRGLSPRGD
jgi:putative ABC transport system ATP-binding protein